MRARKKPVKRKAATPAKRTTARSKKRSDLNLQSNPYAMEFEHIQKEIKKAYNKLEKDLKNHASQRTLQNDNNRLFLLLGECHYLARQCWQKTHSKRK